MKPQLPAAARRLREARRAAFAEIVTIPRALRCYRRWSRAVDCEMVALFREYFGTDGPSGTGRDLCLVAVGGYGRQEMAPYSDVDLMLLRDDDVEWTAAKDEALGGFVAALWDTSLEISHSVRTLRECCDLVVEDEVSATAVLEGRSLAGDRRLFERLRAPLLPEALRGRGRAYLQGRLRQLRSRRQFYGGSASQWEPNVKESPGGLRDLHEARWVRRALDARDAPEVGRHDLDRRGIWRAWDWLARLRALLHVEAGRRQDHLAHDSQAGLAESLGFVDAPEATAAESLMRRSLREMRRIQESALAAEERLVSALRPANAALRRRPVFEGFVAVGDRLHVCKAAILDQGIPGHLAMRVFLEAQRRRLQVSTALGQALRQRAAEWGDEFRKAPENAELFRRLLGGRGNVGQTLASMHRYGVLGAYLPEFADTDALVRANPYHQWSVDEHLLRSVQELDRLETDPDEGVKRAVFHVLPRPWLLKLALLLHDIGKAGPGDHVERGLVVLPDLMARIGLRRDESELLSWLVEDHLYLIRAQRRLDLADPAAFDAVLRRVASLERLRCLYLLTVCDSRATSKTALPRWMDSLLTETFERIERALTDRKKSRSDAAIEGLRDFERREPEAARPLREFVDQMPRRYTYDLELKKLPAHQQMVERVRAGEPLVMLRGRREEAVEVWFAVADRHGIFADLCAVLFANQLAVVSADLYTHRQGVVLDRVLVVPWRSVDANAPGLWKRVESDFGDLSAGRRQGAELVASRQEYRSPSAAAPSAVIHRLRIDRRVSPGAVVLELEVDDRPGLLFTVATAVAQSGLQIRRARIATVGAQVQDRFSLSAPEGKIGLEQEQSLLRNLRQALETPDPRPPET